MGLLNREIEAYSRRLAAKPFVLLLNKVDFSDGAQVGSRRVGLTHCPRFRRRKS